MYSKCRNIVIGFHGCDKSVRDAIVNGAAMQPSSNSYDWLGWGFYFWENDLERAKNFAREKQERDAKTGKITIKEPAVLGAIIDLGKCLDFTNSAHLKDLKENYDKLKDFYDKTGIKLPENQTVGNSFDLLLRDLDCIVIESLHTLRADVKEDSFDSVRGVFWEGENLYPNAGFKEKNHIQICVRNINCIKSFFIPRQENPNYPVP